MTLRWNILAIADAVAFAVAFVVLGVGLCACSEKPGGELNEPEIGEVVVATDYNYASVSCSVSDASTVSECGVVLLQDGAQVAAVDGTWSSELEFVAEFDGLSGGETYSAVAFVGNGKARVESASVSFSIPVYPIEIGDYLPKYQGVVYDMTADSLSLISLDEIQYIPWKESKAWCESYLDGSWYMPCIEELATVHDNIVAVNNGMAAAGVDSIFMGNECYWSSTEYEELYAYRYHFNDGKVYYYGMDEAKTSNMNRCRAVKKVVR